MKHSVSLTIAPSRVLRGKHIIPELLATIRCHKILTIGGKRAYQLVLPLLQDLDITVSEPIAECSEVVLDRLQKDVEQNQPSLIMAMGGGKVMDSAKLIADRNQLPIVTIPTSGATCAAWTALSNVYTPEGAFAYDVPLTKCPDYLVMDYELLATAPVPTLIAGIGDAIAKWYEASVSSGDSDATLVISAVQSARVLRDILLQKSKAALEQPGSLVWQEVIDGTIVMAGVIGGLGGAQCRTVAAHAVHNGLTHLPQSHSKLHGEKVAYGILVQLRLEEFQGNQLAATARHQLLQFYREIGLPTNLTDLGLGDISLAELSKVAEIACNPRSDIHRLPFLVSPEQLQAAMVSTTAPLVLRA
ncbi:MAG: oxidoreductase [Cyanobacteria bacterium M5B4]|nr:iron-containing alcohol dehydrogenase family protein [Cyanobacteria bacterium KgW148]PLS67731.1 MAG: oxidoreductase [Cyanobacteria bacterium M5B4]